MHFLIELVRIKIPMGTANRDSYDVIIIGGGPSGSTVAALVAEKGHSVLLLERDPLPRFKIGESLMPATYWTFKRLGVLGRLKASLNPKKYSVQFFSGSGMGSAPFYFFEDNSHECSVTWQVLRSEFDQMLLENAREKGAEIRRGVIARDVLFQGDQAVGVRARIPEGKEVNFAASVVVDASGQGALVSRKLKSKTADPNLKKASIFTHFKGSHRDKGIDEGATLILHTENKDSWFWYIPLSEDRASVGVVGELDYLLRDRQDSPQMIFEDELERCQALKRRLAGAEQVFPAKVTQDVSYRSSRIAGHGWVLVGDAFGFLDPIYSSGVFLALKSGELAADAINLALEDDCFTEDRLGGFAPELIGGMENIRKLIYAFYTKDFSFSEFLMEFPECRQGIVDILSGNIFKEGIGEIFPKMDKMCSGVAGVGGGT